MPFPSEYSSFYNLVLEPAIQVFFNRYTRSLEIGIIIISANYKGLSHIWLTVLVVSVEWWKTKGEVSLASTNN